MKGYKAFNKDLSCKGYRYLLNKTNVFKGEPKLCDKGFHFCTELQDIIRYYCNPDMRVFEIEASGIITDAEFYCSKRACSELKIIRELSLDEVAKFITEPQYAYKWANYVGNIDVMVDKINDSENAYWWAIDIGNRDIMIDKIIEPHYIKLWVYEWPEDKQYFVNKGLIA